MKRLGGSGMLKGMACCSVVPSAENMSFWNSSVGVVTVLSDGWSGIWFPAGAGDFLLLQNVGSSSRVYPGSFGIGSGALPRGKMARVRRWPMTSISAEAKNGWSHPPVVCLHGHCNWLWNVAIKKCKNWFSCVINDFYFMWAVWLWIIKVCWDYQEAACTYR